ncbi:hypothetical protein ONS95_004670 [Cadophora gregata]|uniref:uncharacterized protein n=1 Tax=Cadophora gregata TaxID=51156 RepID=UPI0026DC3AF5|nr:uncharacterized protein ONS95_004670 [Cadophora gregata]KAK0104376.1 hypothetical protein ONS95_004670 [Cadophora gregata]
MLEGHFKTVDRRSYISPAGLVRLLPPYATVLKTCVLIYGASLSTWELTLAGYAWDVDRSCPSTSDRPDLTRRDGNVNGVEKDEDTVEDD